MERDLTEKEREMIVNFGALGYSVDKMAVILMWDVKEIADAMSGGDFARLYQKGQAIADYVIDMKLFELSQTGDLKALAEFEKRKRRSR
jgi:hypothetical protein